MKGFFTFQQNMQKLSRMLSVFLLFLSALGTNVLGVQNDGQPKIITTDGNIKFQSAKNKNISFELEGNADVNFGGTSLKEIKSTLNRQTDEIKKLFQVGEGQACSQNNPCGTHGVCIDVLTTSTNQDAYKCICQGLFSGKHCDVPDPCSGVVCQNNGQCQEFGGRGFCVCVGNWFGATCSVPKPTDCMFKKNDKVGVISSPGYPESYPNNMDCMWELETTPGHVMHIVVMVTFIGFSPVCTTDYLEIKDASLSQVLAKLCGDVPEQTFLSVSNKIQIRFKTGPVALGIGFSIFYSETKNEKCGGRLTVPSSIFEAKGTTDQPCVWVVDTNSDEKLKLQFNSLMISNTEGSCDNYLEIRSGDSSDAPLFQKICHSNASRVFHTESPKLFVVFVSKTEHNSVSGKYYAECGGVINLKEGDEHHLKSPFYPSRYPAKQKCEWVFHADEFKLLSIMFLDVSIEPHTSCSLDKITVEDGKSVLSYCGDKEPLPITSVTNRLVVGFQSDSDMDFKGFSAIVSVSDPDCSRTINANEGSLSSPRYPSYYGENKDCVYTIVSEDPNRIIEFSFETFDLEESSGCLNDYVEIFDGSSQEFPKMHSDKINSGRFCGPSKPEVSVTTGRSLTVRFHSNQNVSSAGFLASWRTFTSSGCNQYLTKSSGFIQSPSYPSDYTRNLDCRIQIESQVGHNIQLSFSYFNLELSKDCDKDYVSVYDGPNEGARQIGKFCGLDAPGKLVSSGNFLFARFHTDVSTVAGGFYAQYTTGTNLCGGTLQGPSGFLTSPGYPSAYSPDLECNWIIKATNGNTLTVTLDVFELDVSDDCSKNDYFKIHDGKNGGAVLLDTLCGTVNSKTYKSSGQYFYIKFRSDKQVQWKGFSLRYEESCSHILNARSGVILSPNYPLAYPSLKTCTWIVEGNRNDIIKINTTFFDVERGSSCQFDSLQITDGPNTEKYCSDNGPAFTSVNSLVALNFTSDRTLVGKGFKLQYVIEGCSKDFTSESGSFSTPNYPQTYPPNSYCVWRIRVPFGKKIKLDFSAMELESDCSRDFVAVYNGYTTESPQLGLYCSKRSGFVLESSGHEMSVIFESSLLRERKGFKAQYTTIDGGCGGVLSAISGTFHSPGYPSQYLRSSMCEWTIDVNTTQRISININSLDLANANGQCNDYLQITDGTTFNVLRKFCDSQVNETIISAVGNKMVVKFVSDNSSQGNGFKIDYKLACGGEVTVGDENAVLTSPHYPSYYEEGECQWLLKTTPDKKILVNFVDFSIESCFECSCDYLQVHDGSDQDSAALLGKYCGENVPANIISTGNNLFITLKADKFVHNTGFKAILSTNTATCGGTLTSYSGNIVSPLYPNNSPNDADCIWSIEVSQGSLVNFIFQNVFASTDCNSTYIQLYDGSSTSGQLLQTVCNAVIGTSFFSTSNKMTVQFFTNQQHAGFAAAYVSNCDNLALQGSAGVIESPGYPRFYPSDVSCQWSITVPEGKAVTFTFDDFDLEVGNPICSDYVVVFNGETFNRATINLCGNNLPNSITLNWRRVFFRFVVDSFIQRHGFKVRYSITDFVPTCGGNLIASKQQQFIASPGFPNNYPILKDCQWEITSPRPDLQISLSFLSFDIEADRDCSYDYVEVNRGGDTVPAKYCGDVSQITSSIESVGPKMVLSFLSDYSFTRKGFNASIVAACFSVRTATKGVIKTHQDNSTQEYLPDTNCRWEISHPPGGIIKLKFTAFEIEQSVNCTKDYVLVLNGGTETSTELGRFCGNNVPSAINSTGHEVLVIFVSDGQNNGAGFNLEYERHIDGCGGVELLADPSVTYEIQSPKYPVFLPSNTECEWTLQVPPSFIIEFAFHILNLSSDATPCSEIYLELTSGDSSSRYCAADLHGNNQVFKSTTNEMKVRLRTGPATNIYPGFLANWKIGCGGNFLSSFGSIKSQAYPASYPIDSECLYSIKVPDSSKQAILHFTMFDLEGSDQQCGDSVKVYEDIEQTRLLGTYCGSTIPFSIVSSTNILLVKFTSDSSNSPNKGFIADFSTSQEQGCGSVLRETGSLSSPSYPNGYPIGRRCVWELYSSQDLAVELDIEELDIAQSVNCTEDYLEIRSGSTADSPVLGRYCGQQAPSLIYSSGNTMRVELVSNRDNRRGRGFKAKFKSSHLGCGGRVTGNSGYITTAGYPNTNYRENTNCEWVIRAADPTHSIQVNFLDFDVEEGSDGDCRYDYLDIRDGSTSSGALLQRLCGFQPNLPLISSLDSSLYLNLRSDFSTTGRGFNISWNANAPQCGGTLDGSQGEIKSPNYPSSYAANGHTDCVWLGELPEGSHVSLTIEDFDIPNSLNCSDGKVVIQNGQHIDSPIVATLCGNLTEMKDRTFTMSGSHFRVHLISETTVSSATAAPHKFKIAYTTKQLGCGGLLLNEEGVITSPDYPANYAGDLSCEWIIRTSPGNKILLHVEDLDITDSCDYDYVEIVDGVSHKSASLAKLCHIHIDQSVYESTSNVMTVRFISDSSISGKGFKLSYNTGCGGVLKGRQGFAQSPGYPGPYPTNADCRWYVQVQPHYSVRVTKAIIDLPPPNALGLCNKDAVFIRDVNETGTMVAQLCGQQTVENFKTELNPVFLSFQSDGDNDGNQYTGTKAYYDTVCGEHIKNSLSGTISLKPNNGLYDSNEVCEWLIEFPVGKRISLTTTFFNLESGFPGCVFDKLEIRDGMNASAPFFGKFCGNYRPPHMQSSTNFLYITFKSDRFDNGQGFVMEYSEAPLRCGGSLSTDSSMFLTSPNYPEEYDSNEDCGWAITAPEGKSIEVSFNDFSITDVSGLCEDYLVMYDTNFPSEAYRITNQICGSTAPSPIITLSNQLYMQLHSEEKAPSFITARKFNATIKVVDKVCGGEYIAGVGETKSLTVSGLANGTSCEYMFSAPHGQHVSVKIISMNMQPRNGNGACTSNQVVFQETYLSSTTHVFCGDNPPPTFRGSHNHVIMFLKDLTTQNSITLEYTTKTDCHTTYTDASGLVTSPNYPLPYPNNLDCQLLIQAPVGQIISLYPVTMHVEQTSTKCIDKVDIYDGSVSDSSQQLGNKTYCGTTLPPALVSSGPNLLVHFTSDQNKQPQGFAFTYLVHSPSECGGELSGSQGAISTPSYPAYYTDNLSCVWNITVSEGKRIKINVPSFESETPIGSTDCTTVDYLELTDGVSNSLGQFCGTSRPAPRTTTSNKLAVKFISNNVHNSFRGFRLTYEEV